MDTKAWTIEAPGMADDAELDQAYTNWSINDEIKSTIVAYWVEEQYGKYKIMKFFLIIELFS